jgi:5-methyltetrahydrofolate--homocysteine methyltransferase
MTRLKYYDEDWDQIRDVLTAWWNHEKPPSPALAVTAPREKPLPCAEPPAPRGDWRERWLDADATLRGTEAALCKTYHGGCSFPHVTACLGPGSLGVFLGSPPHFAETTVWYDPCYSDPAGVNLSLSPDNAYWKWTVNTTRQYQAASRGKYLVAMPDMIEGLDTLAALLGTQELLTYLLDKPREIHRLLRQVNDLYWRAFDPLYDIIKDERGGNAFMAFQIWGPGRTLKSQCDFSAMISPDMFAEFVCPYLEEQCARADFSVFHLDGPSCIGHLKHLLSVPSLKAVQWTPGAGSESVYPGHRVWWDRIWRPVYAAGKSALVLSNTPDLVEPFLKEFGWKGTYLSSSTTTERAARKLLVDSWKWGGG